MLNGSENSLSSSQCSLKSANLCSNSLVRIPMSTEYFSYLTVVPSLVDRVVNAQLSGPNSEARVENKQNSI